jgi:type IV pilus assembly protein PilM
MARRLIGLDIGTNAVTIAEVTAGNPPRLDMFAQVALPRDAMREGEVADEAAVSDAVARLRTEVGLKRVPVRVGIASPRVVVRQVEMPLMTRDELASALQFQAGDLIPIPIEDAVLDFAILGTSNPAPDSGIEPTMQVLLVAAYAATVVKLVSAVEAGGLQVAAVDLIPLALTRALARPVAAMAHAAAGGVAVEEAIGAEGIVSFGGGVTAIAVHEDGVPQFVRVLGSGGRELTDAIATDLAVPAEAAEALKRALANPGADEMVARARTAVDRPLSLLLDEVRSSIDYYRNQPGSAQLRRVVVTGGSAQLPGLPERLSALVGVPVEPAYMHDLLRIGDIGFAPDELPRLEPYLPAPVGLALGGANVGVTIDLLPRNRGGVTTKTRGRMDQRAIAAAVVAAVALTGATYLAHNDQSSAKAKSTKAQAAEAQLRTELSSLQTPPATGDASAAALKSRVVNVLGQDVVWPAVISKIGLKLPPGVYLNGFQGQHTLPTVVPGAGAVATPTATAGSATAASATAGSATAGSATPGASAAAAPAPVVDPNDVCAGLTAPEGAVSISGGAPDLAAVAAFEDALKPDTDLTVLWVTTVKAATGAASVEFTLTASLGSTARGHRLETFFKGAKCK